MADDRVVKHFDRRFVASNLKKLLLCPKCSSDYTHTQDEQSPENHRPFLLPCGHSLCENCLSADRQNLTCAVCQKPAHPLINAKNADSKSGVGVRDFYELNYHVLGEACSLTYFHNLDTLPVSEFPSHSLVIVPATKCNECNNAAAMGKCSQCSAFYCSNCFDVVHKRSRVLKTHTFQNTYVQSQGIRVGNHVFQMPRRGVCSSHRLIMNIYCIVCRRNHCPKCSALHHMHHKTQTVSEINQLMASEIPSTLKSLNSALKNIHNSQEVVRATKQKLSDYASETLASVSKYFSHLHGLLQVAEQQVVVKLRESSLQPQMKLIEAMGTLSDYEAVIKHLKQYLDKGLETEMGVPHEVRLKEIISLTNEHLQKIPSTVHVSQIKVNPYSIDSDPIDISTIDQKFKYKFVDPEIKVSFKAESERELTISSINKSDITFGLSSNNGKENASQSTNKGPPRQQPLSQKSNFNSMSNSQKRRPRSSSSKLSLNSTVATCDSFQPRSHHQLDFVGSFSALDIAKATNATRKAEKGDWFKDNALVNVRSINSPEDFYVQGIHVVQRVREELETITQSMTEGRCTPPDIVLGQHYIIFHQDQNRYFRAMVIQKMATQDDTDTYKVFLPDIGLFVELASNHFREMPERLSHLPYSAVHCKLGELMPRSGADSEWDSEAITLLKQIVKNNPVHLKVIKALSHDLHEVDLITNNYNTSISVRESFLYSGLARSRCGRSPQKAPINLRLPKPKLQSGDIFMVQMLHVEHPEEFYVMPHDMESERCQKQSNLQRHMDRLSLSTLENIFLGRLQLGCVLQLTDGQWKRASIEQILPDGYVLVRLVDDGPCQKVFWNQLFVLPSEFWEPERTLKCRLADVETLQDFSYAWTPEATACFKQLTSNPKQHIEVIKFTEDVVYVALRFARGGSETNVAVEMIAYGHCKSSGESSRVFITTPLPWQRSTRLDFDARRFREQQKVQAVELTPFREAEEETKEDQRNQRIQVKVLYVRHPDEFYITLPHFMPLIENLRKTVQKAAEEMHHRDQGEPRTDWKVGDMCYVRVQAQSDLESLWHRGLVTGVNSSPCSYHVHLRDFGQVAEDVPPNCMTNIDELNMTIASSAKRCHLHGVQPVGTEWSADAIALFKDRLQVYDQLYVTGQASGNNSLSVILWGTFTVVSGPFSPARTKFVNINQTLLRANLAEKNINDGQKPMLDYISFSSGGTTSARDLKEIQNWVDKSKNAASRIDDPIVLRPAFEHYEDMPPLKLLDDLGKDHVTTGQTVAPTAWTTPRECGKTIFAGMATNVTNDCDVYLTLGNDKPYLEHMRKLLELHYKPLMEEQQEQNRSYDYEVGQPVLVTYHMDSLLYRGIVRGPRNNEDMYKVYYVDYGNMERVKADDMLPYAPFPQLNAMCWLVSIYGVRPKGRRYTIQQLDTVHKHLIMKLSSVRVMEASARRPTCSIRVGNVDTAAMMIDRDMAISTETTTRQTTTSTLKSSSQQQQGLDEFRQFVELENLVSGLEQRRPVVPPPRRTETDSSEQQPLAKKYLVKSEEMNRFDNDQDFDCQEAAQEMYANNNSNFSTDSDEYSIVPNAGGFNIEEDEDTDELDTEYSHEMDIDIGGEESSDSPSDDMEIEPLSVSGANQLQRRIDLHHKDMKENIRFSPKDTSSERSYFDGSNSFKTLSLPTGVKEFDCRVDNVLSAVELQITPCLSEFNKHERTLDHETSLLIKGAAALAKPKLNDLCLARYSQDKRWYRAIVKEIQESTQQATVFYIDFHDTERVSYTHLKEMPDQLFMFPLRSFRVKLYGVKKNRSIEDKQVRRDLKACLYSNPQVHARVHYPFNYHANNSAHSEAGECSGLIEVQLFENKNKKKLVYQSLIDSRKLIPKKNN